MPADRATVELDATYVDQLRTVGERAGLTRLGIASPEPFDDVRVVLERRKQEGLHGGMQFTYRNPARSTDPSRALPGVRAIVVGARRYTPQGRPGTAPGDTGGAHEPTARVARYSAHDHYRDLQAALEAVAARLRDDGWQARIVLDDNALVDRAAAHRAGLGWYGKNSNILLPGEGSWFVLGNVLTDAPLPPATARQPDGCGTCQRCIDGCPTGAIVAPGVVDARRCLAWLVQAEGDFPEEHRAALGDRIYGCDDCQEVCPPNRRHDELGGTHHSDQPGAGSRVPLLDLLTIDDAELLARHGRWYIPRRDPDYVRRNALVALGNTAAPGDPAAHGALDRYERHPNEMLRRHARWARARLRERAAES